MRRFWTYALAIVALPVVLAGSVILVGAGVDAYIVGIGGAKPGDATYLDTLAQPLPESLFDMAVGGCIITIGLLIRALDRHLKRAAS